MNYQLVLNFNPFAVNKKNWRLLPILLALLFAFQIIKAQAVVSSDAGQNSITVEEISDGEIFSFGKNVIVKKQVKGVLAFGGDVIIEGGVEGDVAAIGGSVIQKKDAYVGGDVIVFGGKYLHENAEPLRGADKATIMYAGYEEELREITKNPSSLFAPQLSWSYFGQRVFSIIAWFAIGLIFTTVAPGAVGRAVNRLRLDSLKVAGLGLSLLVAVTILTIFAFSLFSPNASGVIGAFVLILMMLAYFFGRVSLQAAFGKWALKKILPEKYRSESVALLLGATIWTVLLSIPYLWTLAVVYLFSASLGLIFASGSEKRWNSERI